jgi:predicted O-methyltransferase YrrM
MTADQLIDISFFATIADPRVFGRDSSNPYYDFLTHIVRGFGASSVLELGTYSGGSTSYLGAARPECRVLTIDFQPQPGAAERLGGFPNVEVLVADTLSPSTVQKAQAAFPFDLIFFDTLHEYNQISQEWSLYRPLLRPGGVALFDDIRINEGMMRFWNELEGQKQPLNHLHHSGFGALIVEFQAMASSAKQ